MGKLEPKEKLRVSSRRNSINGMPSVTVLETLTENWKLSGVALVMRGNVSLVILL